MNTFVDMSAFYAVLNADDESNQSAKQVYVDLITQEADLVSANYVLLEIFALVQHRLGMDAVRTLQEDVVPMLRIEWASESRHVIGVMALLTASSRKLSLVDCVCFEIMRRQGIKIAFAFDRHFVQQGFETIT